MLFSFEISVDRRAQETFASQRLRRFILASISSIVKETKFGTKYGNFHPGNDIFNSKGD